MADVSAEPSMEEILSSIKRIIAEEEAPTGRRRAAARPLAPPPPPEPEEGEDGVLELNDPMPPVPPEPEPVRADFPPQPAEPAPQPQPPERDLLVSTAAADATRGALQSLSKLAVKAEPQSDGSFEGVVREMLRPMLREWLDTHLPDLVEAMVAKEIARISGRQP